ncbi:MAG: c-type cytochrome [Gammaproteobacteria bacterium]
MTAVRRLAVFALVLSLAGAVQSYAMRPRAIVADAPSSPAGEAIYLHGVLPSGKSLMANRAGAEPMQGEQAACANCHQRSGLGANEERNVIPPITGKFLFHSPSDADDAQLPYIPGARLGRQAYDDQTLARAIRDGVDADGHQLSYLMPRYALNDADLAALVAHLRSLDRSKVPGVSSTDLQFATIITPDADPVKRRGMLDVLEQFFKDRNIAPRGQSAQTMTTSGNTAYVKRMFKVNRHWVLHVWELTGPSATWTKQLEAKFAAEPVFAVISGIGGGNWAPVNAFCEERAVACLFPNVELPPADADRNFHTVYFSRGVLLEADLIATALMGDSVQAAPRHVRQVYRAGDVGEAGAQALAAQLQARGISVSNHVIPKDAATSSVIGALHEPSDTDALVVWLRAADLLAAAEAPAPLHSLYLSGLMGGLDATPLPASWRGQAHIAYPFDLSERRRVRVDFARGWFRFRNVPVVAEQVQVDTYLACGLLSETLKHMVDAFIPDYLIESLYDTVEHRIITGYYPRLTLGPHQRFASKGGFMVHLDGSGKPRLVPDGKWITP